MRIAQTFTVATSPELVFDYVTDPANPKYVKFIPGPDNTWTIQTTLHDNLMITALQKSAPGWDTTPRPRTPTPTHQPPLQRPATLSLTVLGA